MEFLQRGQLQTISCEDPRLLRCYSAFASVKSIVPCLIGTFLLQALRHSSASSLSNRSGSLSSSSSIPLLFIRFPSLFRYFTNPPCLTMCNSLAHCCFCTCISRFPQILPFDGIGSLMRSRPTNEDLVTLFDPFFPFLTSFIFLPSLTSHCTTTSSKMMLNRLTRSSASPRFNSKSLSFPFRLITSSSARLAPQHSDSSSITGVQVQTSKNLPYGYFPPRKIGIEDCESRSQRVSHN